MDSVQTILTEELTALKETIADNIRSAGAVASGRTLNSLRVEVSDMQGVLYGGLPEGAPFGTLETGRKAGKVPRGFAGIIEDWMKDKGIHGTPIPYKRASGGMFTPQERGDKQMAGAIAHTIQKSGTKLHRDGGRSNIYSEAIEQTISNIQSRLIATLETEIQHIHLNI